MAVQGFNPLFVELVVYGGALFAASLPVVALLWAQSGGYPFQYLNVIFLDFFRFFLNHIAQVPRTISKLNNVCTYNQIYSTNSKPLQTPLFILQYFTSFIE